jgi:uroporphyrinogen decarboxylase
MRDVLDNAPDDVLCMGNIDPVSQFTEGTETSMREAVNALLSECAAAPNFLLSSGCDIPPNAKWENIDAFFRAAEEFECP